MKRTLVLSAGLIALCTACETKKAPEHTSVPPPVRHSTQSPASYDQEPSAGVPNQSTLWTNTPDLFHVTQTKTNAFDFPDPIERLVARLTAAGTMWQNGGVNGASLPETAPPEKVVEAVLSRGLASGERADFKIVNTRQVRIPSIGNDRYTAVVVQHRQKKEIVLLQYQPSGWWARIYDAE